MNEEIQLLKMLEGACAQARRMGTAATAKVALRYEERFAKERERLESKLAEVEQEREPVAAAA